MKAPVTIIFPNQKGGVGKTTLTRELGVYLGSLGLKILLVDADPQGNLSKSLTDREGKGLYEALIGCGIEITETEAGVSLLYGGFRLIELERILVGEIDGYTKMRKLLSDPVFKSFDYIMIDSPPSLGVLSVNSLAAARYFVIPINPTLYSLQGTNDLFTAVSKVSGSLNAEITFLGVIINAYDSIPVIQRQITSEIREAFGSEVFPTVLSKSVKLEEAIALKQGVIMHRRLDRSRAREEVGALGDELLKRIKERRETWEVRDGVR